MPENDGGNGRVTLAVLGEKLDHIETMLATHIGEDHKTQDDHEKRIRANEKAVTQLDLRQRQTTGILASIQVIVGGVAAWVGSKL